MNGLPRTDGVTVRRVVIDHVKIGVSDLARSRAFYVAALAPLGFGELYADESGISFGPPGVDDFIVSTLVPTAAGLHVAFAAERRDQVDAFHAAALAAGGVDNGAPGPRTQYSAGYYGAFVLDPDGHNVEAVCHGG
ncbi:VOC family protein [Conexibacter woesei]|uniref:Glyoxalase/bleomycin resistance protein/dioxygenase n=1 Tax=Conexibacter woesei (strain DSM 14684 / CCUG 47730 / CIP 108061 / JCM 11494 / NBRC 100937 / ID131577) TaxID=469383 RepID=D3EYX3_CONWI|nr:VOC family protein [Conexibacter woesei]ADB49847.1 Glyoxalase/bleomycin resistance protein/dioxygenase [Conexibacter woesei DSM 14684]